MSEKFLLRLREKIPFLRQIPDDFYFSLDTAQFVLPDAELAKARTELEDKLGYYVMTYNAKKAGGKKHLCSILKTAELNDMQLLVLRKAESEWKQKGVSFCVYRKPLGLIEDRF